MSSKRMKRRISRLDDDALCVRTRHELHSATFKQIHHRSNWLSIVLFCWNFSTAQSQRVPIESPVIPIFFPTRAPAIAPPTPPPAPFIRTLNPTNRPTLSFPPTISPQPSPFPTISPGPTLRPTINPTGFPSFMETDIVRVAFRQDFLLEGCTISDEAFCRLNATQIQTIESILEAYTPLLVADASRVETECTVDAQSNEVVGEGVLNTGLDYTCTYMSRYVKLDEYADRLLGLINSPDAPTFLDRLRREQLPVTVTDDARLRILKTSAPTTSPAPSYSPTLSPTQTRKPSHAPTSSPTRAPIESVPSAPVSDTANGDGGENDPTPTSYLNFLVPMAVISGLAALGGVVFFYRSYKKSTAVGLPLHSMTPSSDMGETRPVSPADSRLSRKSFVSRGESDTGDEVVEENDGTKNLQYEFERTAQNMEQPQRNAARHVTPVLHGVKNQAVNNSLLLGQKSPDASQHPLWGCDVTASETEIEASALFEVCDWIKRNDSANIERKAAFMQEILGKMVAIVRDGVARSKTATRTIHESAALMGLELAEELPPTTLIISGMGKTTTSEDMKNAFGEFGEIDVAAVAAGNKGFGIVRFRRVNAVDRALRRYRSAEIVILDVSIQMKLITENEFAVEES